MRQILAKWDSFEKDEDDQVYEKTEITTFRNGSVIGSETSIIFDRHELKKERKRRKSRERNS